MIVERPTRAALDVVSLDVASGLEEISWSVGMLDRLMRKTKPPGGV